MLACRGGHTTIASVLIEFGAHIRSKDNYGVTALHWQSFLFHSRAANYGKGATVLLLIQKGRLVAEDLNQRDLFGSTPLHFAAVRNRVEALKVLLDSGADPMVTNNDGRKPSDLTTDDLIRKMLMGKDNPTHSWQKKRIEP